ncbi:transcriptional regulator, PadR-like family [Beutenbergia cavernae DSM 12333]|uniref:Transcriptional regulator, PadR-like family n=2 Tax=Beutenbergia TaxID=84756 RepID=C5C640_BEUC1|nr:transcriptional regulator, PadR-like family [Beutenbergia cavernae DSM 12333]
MAVLGLLQPGPAHGFAIKRRYDELIGRDRELKYGQVYSTLARLERDGLASGVGVQPGGGGDRKVYAITDAGVTELETWLMTPQLPQARPAELVTRVVLALVAGRPAEPILDGQRRVYLARMRELTAARKGADAVARALADFEQAHLEADLRWIELAAARLGPMREALNTGEEATDG